MDFLFLFILSKGSLDNILADKLDNESSGFKFEEARDCSDWSIGALALGRRFFCVSKKQTESQNCPLFRKSPEFWRKPKNVYPKPRLHTESDPLGQTSLSSRMISLHFPVLSKLLS